MALKTVKLRDTTIDLLKATKHQGQSYDGFIQEMLAKHTTKRNNKGRFIKENKR